MTDKNIVLDQEAEQLFRDLGGVDAGAGPPSGKVSAPGLAEALHDEEKRRDAWRLLMVDYAHELAVFIGVSRSGAAEKVREAINRLAEVFRKLATMPDHGGKIHIRFQGRVIPGAGVSSENYDYVMSLGTLLLDIPQVKDTARRLGVTASHMPPQATQAFVNLDKFGLGNLDINIGQWTGEDQKNVRRCLELLSGYLYSVAVEKGEVQPSKKEEDGLKIPLVKVVYDERSRPDPNLSLLAAYNGVNVQVISQLVKKISRLMIKAAPGDPLEQFVNVFEAIFGFKKLRDQLKKPLIEMDNIRWLMVETPGETISRYKSKLTRLIQLEFGNNPQKTARILDSLYANDYGFIDAYVLGQRLALASEVITAIESRLSTGGLSVDVDVNAESLLIDLLGNVEGRLDLVADEVYSSLTVAGNVIVASSLDGETTSGRLDPKLLGLVEFFSQRTVTKKKMKRMVETAIEFDIVDFQTIARDFAITVKDAQDLVALLRGCFDPGGHFRRRDFEKNIPAFSRHEKKVFEFLWYYLKEIMDRQDRIAFLNAFQFLIDRMKQRERGLGVLLGDFVHDPENVTFYDRNALMLSTLLLRKYNKELHNDIEITPEEVLMVKEGLDHDAGVFTSDFIDQCKDPFFLKIRSIHRALKDCLDPFGARDTMPPRYIFTLEREVYILLALVGGGTARAVLRSAAREYGNPEAEVYWLKNSQQQLPGLMQIFQVVIRALGKVGRTSDLIFLKELRSSQSAFFALQKEPQHRDLVRRAMGWVDKSIVAVTKNQRAR